MTLISHFQTLTNGTKNVILDVIADIVDINWSPWICRSSKNAEHVVFLPNLTFYKRCCKRQLLPSVIMFLLIPYYDRVSINIKSIKEYETFSGLPCFKFTNGSIFEISQYYQDKFTSDLFTNLVSTFSGKTKLLPQALKNTFDTVSNIQPNLLKKEDKFIKFLKPCISVSISKQQETSNTTICQW